MLAVLSKMTRWVRAWIEADIQKVTTLSARCQHQSLGACDACAAQVTADRW